jgi:hypothetical protein
LLSWIADKSLVDFQRSTQRCGVSPIAIRMSRLVLDSSVQYFTYSRTVADRLGNAKHSIVVIF